MGSTCHNRPLRWWPPRCQGWFLKNKLQWFRRLRLRWSPPRCLVRSCRRSKLWSSRSSRPMLHQCRHMSPQLPRTLPQCRAMQHQLLPMPNQAMERKAMEAQWAEASLEEDMEDMEDTEDSTEPCRPDFLRLMDTEPCRPEISFIECLVWYGGIY